MKKSGVNLNKNWFCFLLVSVLIIIFFSSLSFAEDSSIIDSTGTENQITRGSAFATSISSMEMFSPEKQNKKTCINNQRCKEIDQVWSQWVAPVLGSTTKVWDVSNSPFSWKEFDEVYPPPSRTYEQTKQDLSPSSGLIVISTELSDLRGEPSISECAINKILSTANSPAASDASSFYNYGKEYGIDPAFALAFFKIESSYGTSKRWVGRVSNCPPSSSHNVGNIRYSSNCKTKYGGKDCSGFCHYQNWDDGIRVWYGLIAHGSHYFKKGRYTLEEIIPVYAPAHENDVSAYINSVRKSVEKYREVEKEFCQSSISSGTSSQVPPTEPVSFTPSSGLFRFAVVSDYHEGDKYTSTLVESIKNQNPHFVIFNGDTINANSGDYKEDWRIFFANVVSPLASVNIPVFHVIGNHDYEGSKEKLDYHNSIWKQFYEDNSNLYSKVNNLDYKYSFPYYSFEYGEKKFVLLDLPRTSIDDTQLLWLKSVLSENSFVFGHVPVVNVKGEKCKSGSSSSDCDRYGNLHVKKNQDKLLTLLDESNSIIFGGHVHYYYKANYRGSGGQYNIPIVFLSTAKSPDIRGIIKTYKNPTVQPPSYAVVDVGGTVTVNAYIRSTDGTYRLFDDTDAVKYFPTQAEMVSLGQSPYFSTFSISSVD